MTYTYVILKELDLLSLKEGRLNGHKLLICKILLQKDYRKLHGWSTK